MPKKTWRWLVNAKDYRKARDEARARVVALEAQLVRACELLGAAVGSTDIPEPTLSKIREFVGAGSGR